MDPLDAEIARLEAKIAAQQSATTYSDSLDNEIARLEAKVGQNTPSYSLGQLAFDVPVGATKAVGGLGDLLMLASPQNIGSKLAAQLTGQPAPESPTLTGLVEQGAEYVAPMLGVRPKTEVQRAVEFMTPLPGGGKLRLAKDVGLGALAYGGEKLAEYLAPESEGAKLAGALLAPMSAQATQLTLAKPAKAMGEAMQRFARGAQAGDYKALKNNIVETVSGSYESRLKTALNRINETNAIGKSVDPMTSYANLQDAKQSIEDQIQTALTSVQSKVGKVPPPTFQTAKQYIQNNIRADEIKDYQKQIKNYERDLKKNSDGKLTYYNQQKKIVGESWKDSPQSDPGFWRAMYGDLKTHIEKYAPEIKDLNKQKQDLIIVEPVLARQVKQIETGDILPRLRKALFYTTGGLGLPGGYMLGGVPGLMLASALGAAATPKGQQMIGKGLVNFAESPGLARSAGTLGFTTAKAANDTSVLGEQ